MGNGERGWFKLPGQEGDRAVADQMRGLAHALEEVKKAALIGRPLTVLDLGCAEGAIALEFAKAGAARVVGLELMARFLEVARELCRGYPCEFQCVDLNRAVVEVTHEGYDVVLALAVLHKLREPARVLRLFAGLARELLVIRMPAFTQGAASPASWEERPPVVFQSERFDREVVDVAKVLAGEFYLARIERGPSLERGPEPVLYFKRLRSQAA
jgi:SAM-dependent methyltransferase